MHRLTVRFAAREDLERINELREMVNELHVNGRPDIFKPGFTRDLKNYLYTMYDEGKDIIVAEIDGKIAGFTAAEIIEKPESPYNPERRFYHIAEFGVDPAFRRLGAASAMIQFCTERAKELGLPKIELDLWEFNGSALAFYESAGFATYRRNMELIL